MNSGDEVGGLELCRLWIGDSQLFGEDSTGEEVQEGTDEHAGKRFASYLSALPCHKCLYLLELWCF
ncbi:hypothetical protein F2Q68_00003989 [Brassica cretica]|uniref:Uncharacterized protein n=1 Tax=Brassica cretica TaxID=69181 RepID=A0A8S9JLI8_BRACR|nr:hypothetical protein F2Q68_00003989 [Brassica cretica]KAF3507376.1 hypothetical protein F2Q69_00004919 [Brassica cretica]